MYSIESANQQHRKEDSLGNYSRPAPSAPPLPRPTGQEPHFSLRFRPRQFQAEIHRNSLADFNVVISPPCESFVRPRLEGRRRTREWDRRRTRSRTESVRTILFRSSSFLHRSIRLHLRPRSLQPAPQRRRGTLLWNRHSQNSFHQSRCDESTTRLVEWPHEATAAFPHRIAWTRNDELRLGRNRLVAFWTPFARSPQRTRSARHAKHVRHPLRPPHFPHSPARKYRLPSPFPRDRCSLRHDDEQHSRHGRRDRNEWRRLTTARRTE